MNDDLKNCKITQTVLNSAMKAFRDYYYMTEGYWVGQTPEYWYSCAIARGLAAEKRIVSLETPASEVRYNANRGKAGRPSSEYRTAGRIDITIWDEVKDLHYPKVVIEIKRGWAWDSKTHGADLDRLCAAVKETGNAKETGTLEFGLFVLVTDVGKQVDKLSANKSLIRKFENIEKKIREHLGGENSEFYVDGIQKAGCYCEEERSMPSIFAFKIYIETN